VTTSTIRGTVNGHQSDRPLRPQPTENLSTSYRCPCQVPMCRSQLRGDDIGTTSRRDQRTAAFPVCIWGLPRLPFERSGTTSVRLSPMSSESAVDVGLSPEVRLVSAHDIRSLSRRRGGAVLSWGVGRSPPRPTVSVLVLDCRDADDRQVNR